jgi:hypothetical protein
MPGLGKHFMHGRPGKPAMQRRIHARMTEHHPLGRASHALRFDPFDPAAQSRKRA